ncbi:hypothetical protein OK016_20405 [Vibrio chagasii]|nr:hypothetical protein [Vibrio chagasii]
MSSYEIPMDIADLGIDYMISLATSPRCTSGFGFVIAKQSELKVKAARLLSLDSF